MTREADIARLVDSAVKRFGRLDCMFNNAGAVTPCKLESVTEQEVRDGLQLLVGSVIFGMKHAARVMKDHGGSIINNASVAAHRFGQGDLLYSAAKAAVAQLTHLAGVELGAGFRRADGEALALEVGERLDAGFLGATIWM